MKKIILNVAITLDGFIEGPNGEYDWCFADQDYGMEEFLKSIDSIFYGRRSYEVLLQSGNNPFAAKRQYVFSNTLPAADGAIVINKDILGAVEMLKQQPGKNIWLFGGAQLTHYFLEMGLVDELLLAVHPLLLGSGKTLFNERTNRIPLELLSSKTYDTGLVQSRYLVKK